ncbi:MAG: pilus assembly protein [Acidobacteria bacterium]|nr:pilus assembly protein [Acidobacteriota bacterium]
MTAKLKRDIKGRRSERGQALLVEFVLSAIFIILLIFSIFELFGFIYTYSVIADAAKEGVRYAIVSGVNSSSSSGPTNATATSPPCTSSSANVTNVVNRVRAFAVTSLHDTSNMNVYVCYLDGNNLMNSQVEVSVNYPFRPFFALGWMPSVTVYANSIGRIVF